MNVRNARGLFHKIGSQRELQIHQVSVIWSSDIWSFWLYFGYMVNGQSDFSTKFFGYMVILAIWSTLPGQNRGPYIRNPVYILEEITFCICHQSTKPLRDRTSYCTYPFPGWVITHSSLPPPLKLANLRSRRRLPTTQVRREEDPRPLPQILCGIEGIAGQVCNGG